MEVLVAQLEQDRLGHATAVQSMHDEYAARELAIKEQARLGHATVVQSMHDEYSVRETAIKEQARLAQTQVRVHSFSFSRCWTNSVVLF